MLKVAISSNSSNLDQPNKVIAALNSILRGQTKEQYATAVYAYLDDASRVVRYSAAGHPLPVLWRKATQRLLPSCEGGLLLGVQSNQAYPEGESSLEAGDRLLSTPMGWWRQPVRMAWNLETDQKDDPNNALRHPGRPVLISMHQHAEVGQARGDEGDALKQ